MTTTVLPLLLLACNDAGLTVHNTEPGVSITSPGNGREWAADQPLVVAASVHDAETELRGLDYYLSDPELGDLTAELSFADPDLVTLTVAEGVPSGERTLTLKVVDPGGKSGTDTVDLSVMHDEPPGAVFQWPADGDRVAVDSPFDAVVVTNDPDEDDLADLDLLWSDAAEGVTEPAHPESSGLAVVEVPAIDALGPATLTVTVTDSMGATGTASVTFEVVDGDKDDDGYHDQDLGGDDCDDDDASVHPGADEVCNGIDDDCDGQIDEDPVDGDWFYSDADLDTWGDESARVLACDGVEGAVDRGGDCDDANSAVNPGALEICNDGLDNDCDGDWSECTWSGQNIHCDSGSVNVAHDQSYDTLPIALAGLDVDGDGIDDLLATSNRVYDGTHRAVNIYQGPVSGQVDESGIDVQLVGNYTGDWTRGALVLPGDFNGDGVDDLIIGEPEGGHTGAGGVYLVHGPVTGDLDLNSDAAGSIASESWSADIGTAVVTGDLDGDGWPDIAMGAPGEETDTYEGGRTYLFTRSTLGAVEVDSYDDVIEGHENSGRSGETLALAGDLDGDGYNELAVGVPGSDAAANRAGAVHLVRGGPSLGTMDLEDAWGVLTGSVQGGWAGRGLASGGDIDGDGTGDLLVGSPEADHGAMHEAGTVSVVLGDSSLAGSHSLSTAAYATLVGQHSYEGLGQTLAAGDWDDDGFTDLLLGAEDGEDTYGEAVGAGYLFYNLSMGESSVTTADAIFRGDEVWHEFGRVVANVGDINGDGVDDLGLGAPYSDASGTSSTGEACLFYGAAP